MSGRDHLRSVPTCSTALTGRRDLIVSNPPYVPAADAHASSRKLRDYEPAAALFAGDGRPGACCGACLVARLGALREEGWLIVEFGFGQDAALRAWLREPRAGRSSACATTCRAFRASRVLEEVERGETVCSAGSSRRDSRRRSCYQDDARRRVQGHQPAGADARARRAAAPHRQPQRPHPDGRRARRARWCGPRAALAKEHGLRRTAGIARCSTATPTRARPSSTSTCTCSADGR